MSSITTDSKLVYIPVLYNSSLKRVSDVIQEEVELVYGNDIPYLNSEFPTEEEAIDAGREMINAYVTKFSRYCEVHIQKRLVPIYK